jgi:glutamine amidotransferase
MRIGIISYGAGNIFSLQSALRRLAVIPILSNDWKVLDKCDKLIFPGVGDAKFAMNALKKNNLDNYITETTKSFLGICLGMQLLCRYSEENDTECLDIFPLTVKRFQSQSLKVPHMGWNRLENEKTTLFKQVEKECFMYFVHSYFVEDSKFSIASCNYGLNFSAAINKDNFTAVQFHPEKSADAGFQILRNFINEIEIC